MVKKYSKVSFFINRNRKYPDCCDADRYRPYQIDCLHRCWSHRQFRMGRIGQYYHLNIATMVTDVSLYIERPYHIGRLLRCWCNRLYQIGRIGRCQLSNRCNRCWPLLHQSLEISAFSQHYRTIVNYWCENILVSLIPNFTWNVFLKHSSLSLLLPGIQSVNSKRPCRHCIINSSYCPRHEHDTA